jgi:hypothetical protein
MSSILDKWTYYTVYLLYFYIILYLGCAVLKIVSLLRSQLNAEFLVFLSHI